MQHRNTLTKILDKKYKINDVIVIANQDTKIIGEEHSKVPIIRIDKLNEYIKNFEGHYDDYDLNEISDVIKLSQISDTKITIKKMKYYILNNKVAICLPILIIAIFCSVIKPLPNNLIANNNNNDSKIEPNIISVSAINQSVDLNSLNTKVNIIKLSKDEKQIVINIDIANNSKKIL